MSLNLPMHIVVMGVSGCGKSTVARALARRLALPLVEADELHPPRNVAMMAAGTPLTDDDRRGRPLHAGFFAAKPDRHVGAACGRRRCADAEHRPTLAWWPMNPSTPGSSTARPCGRWGDVQKLAGAAVFLAGDAPTFVNGHILCVDGGVTATL